MVLSCSKQSMITVSIWYHVEPPNHYDKLYNLPVCILYLLTWLRICMKCTAVQLSNLLTWLSDGMSCMALQLSNLLTWLSSGMSCTALQLSRYAVGFRKKYKRTIQQDRMSPSEFYNSLCMCCDKSSIIFTAILHNKFFNLFYIILIDFTRDEQLHLYAFACM